MLLITTTTIHI